MEDGGCCHTGQRGGLRAEQRKLYRGEQLGLAGMDKALRRLTIFTIVNLTIVGRWGGIESVLELCFLHGRAGAY